MADKALIVVGMSRAALAAPGWGEAADHASLLEAVAGEVSYFRSKQRPVVFTVSGTPDEAAGDLLARIHPALSPDPLETVFAQPSLSAFHGTELERWLREQGVEAVTLVGVRTNVEVLFTAAGAVMRGLRLVVPAGCVAAEETDLHGFALQQIWTVLG